jgi:hypothetical protein
MFDRRSGKWSIAHFLMQIALLIVFTATGATAFFLAGRFNLRTFRLVRGIQGVAKRQGTAWDFYGDFQRMSSFVLRPSNLLDPLDNEEMHAAKGRYGERYSPVGPLC